jgi:hypothetical protein
VPARLGEVFLEDFGQQDLDGRDVTVEAPPVDRRTFGSARVTGERSRGRAGDRCGGWEVRDGRLEPGERGVSWWADRGVLLEEFGQDDLDG